MVHRNIRRATLAAIIGAAVMAPSAFADATPTLEPGDAGASALIDPAPGDEVTAVVEPAGCTDAAVCDYAVTADGGPAPANAGQAATSSVVVPVNGAKIRSVKHRALKAKRHHRRTSRRSARALAALYFEYWGYVHTTICSSAYGCTAWRMTLGSSSWCDTDGWCWGTRSRYSRVGDINCDQSTAGYSISRNDCSDHNDPSKSLFYAAFSADVSGIAHGFPVSASHFIHRHYTEANTWVATG